MATPPNSFRSILLLLSGLLVVPWSAALAADATQIVMQDGKSIPIESLVLQGDKFVVQTATEKFAAGLTFPAAKADHVYGIKPVATNQAIALILAGKVADAKKLLETVVSGHRLTAKIPGNFWLEAARMLVVAHSLSGDAGQANDLIKEISDATPVQGTDPIAPLSKALLLPNNTKVEERLAALGDLSTDNLPADVCGFASYYRGSLLLNEKRPADALVAFLEVPCLFPSGGLALMASAEMQAADLLTAQGRRDEATVLLRSALRDGKGTLIVEQANKRLETLK